MNFFTKYMGVVILALSIQNAYALKATCHSSQDSELGAVEIETFSTAFGERARIKENMRQSLTS